MSVDPNNPQLFGTQRDYAWNAWQTAFGVGNGTGADEAEFQKWWEVAVTSRWDSTKTLMLSAWSMGAAAAAAKAPTFAAWWQQIVDAQPTSVSP